MPPGLNPIHVLVVLVVALIVLGPEKLPEAARTLGKFVSEFRRWSTMMQEEARGMLDVATRPDVEESHLDESQPPAPSSVATPGSDDTPKPVDLNGSAGIEDVANQ